MSTNPSNAAAGGDIPAERQPSMSPAALVRVFLPYAALLAVLVAMFHLRGNNDTVAQFSQSIFRWIAIQWQSEDFANNWLMLPVAALAVYLKRDALRSCEKRPSWTGALFTVGCVAMHLVAYKANMSRISIVAFALAAWGLLLFPLGYLLLCVTSYHLVHFTMHLRLMACKLAEFLLQGAGIGVVRQGTVIFSDAGGGFLFDVADGCSGLRSLVVMTALAAPYAYFTLNGFFRKWALFLLSIPLAMVANALRIFTLSAVADLFGQRLAMTLYHDFSGYLVFIIALLLLMATGRVLEQDWKATCRKHFPRKS